MPNDHAPDPLAETSQANKGHNPLRSSWRESADFNHAWLKNGKTLRPIQRVGFVVISTAFLGGAIFWANVSWTFLQGRQAEGKFFWICFFGVAALVFLFLGYAGLRNALKR